MMRCSHDGCKRMDAELWSVYGTDDSTFALCYDHAAAFGFCLTCGAFIGGTEDVFKVGMEGMCFDCFIQLSDEMAYAGDEYDDEGA